MRRSTDGPTGAVPKLSQESGFGRGVHAPVDVDDVVGIAVDAPR